MAITLVDGTVVPDIPSSILNSYPYVIITYSIDTSSVDTSDDTYILNIKRRYLLHGATKVFRRLTISSDDEQMIYLASDSDIYAEYALDENNNWVIVPTDLHIGQLENFTNNDMVSMIPSFMMVDTGLGINISSLRYSNHNVYYATLNEDSSGSTFEESIILSGEKVDFNIILNNYNGTLLPSIPKVSGYTSAMIIHIQYTALMDMYLCLLLPTDAEFGAYYSTELLEMMPITTIIAQMENAKIYSLNDIYDQWNTFSEEDNTFENQLPLINIQGISINLIYSNKDIPYVIFYGIDNIYNTGRLFYSIKETEKLPDIEHSTEYYAVPASFLNSMARGVRRISGNNERMDYNSMSNSLLNTGDYLKVFNKDIKTIDWELPSSIPIGGFAFCNQLQSIESDNVTSVESYGFAMSGLSKVILPNLLHIGDNAFIMNMGILKIDFPKIISIGNQAFTYCNMLTSINIPNVEYLGNGCFQSTSIESINLPKIITIPDSCFRSCNSLTEVYTPKVTTVGSYGFGSCSKLTDISLPLCTTVENDGFYYCSTLANVDLPLCTSIGNYCFGYCKELVKLDLPSCTYIGNSSNTNYNYAFYNCSKLKALILRSPTMCEINAPAQSSYMFTNTLIASGTGYIYVPSALLSTYQTNTNWSSYSSKFRALENYTVDGTINGAIDETKI